MSKIEQVSVNEVMKKSYMDYATDVINKRALPDIRDGLKPVHRRILFGMNNLKIFPNSSYKKSARIVGEVLGKYHPHGDTSVYDALVRMAQDFSLRYPLIDGHGNFGSVDGDSAAAMRYTEARMSKISLELTKDLYDDTVDFMPNFDGEEQEPVVLPSRFPNLLVNGASGIAVGFACNMPSHNLVEVIDGIIYRLNNQCCNTKDIMQYIKAPDFATGGVITNPQDLLKIYENGRGSIKVRAKYHFETIKKNDYIVFTEIPYQVNKAKLIEDIHKLTQETIVEEKGKKIKIKAKIPEITCIRDESDRNGMRIVIELKARTNHERILKLLYKYSKLQDNFGLMNVALINNQVKENIPLLKLIDCYIDHQKEVIINKSNYDLNKINNRIHILEGLKIALNDIDLTIELIKTSENTKQAKERLIQKLILSEVQAQAVLDLKLQRLTNLDKNKIDEEFNNLLKVKQKLELILNNNDELLNVLKKELINMKDEYGDKRRTEILYEDDIIDISKEDLIEDYNCKILYTKEGYIKKLNKSSEKQSLKEGDEIIEEIQSTNKSSLLFFTNKANRYKLNCYELNTVIPSKIGDYIPNLFELEKDEKVIRVVSIDNKIKGYIICVFENGNVSKVPIKQFMNSYTKLQNCYNTESKLIDIRYVEKDTDILLISKEGKALIIDTTKINAVNSRNTKGVVGIKLQSKLENNVVIDCVVGINLEDSITLKTIKGKEKYMLLNDVAPTGQENENRSCFKYLQGRRGNQGNFLINTRVNNDEVIQLKLN